MPAPLTVSVLSPAEVDRDPDIRYEWQQRVEGSSSLYKLYQSPFWWEHLRSTQGDEGLRLLAVRDATGALRGVAPCELTSHTSVREVFGWAVTVLRARGLELLGSEPLLDDDPEVFEAFFNAVCGVMPGATVCRLKSLPTTSPAWQFLTADGAGPRSFFVKTEGPQRLFYSIEMGESWPEYLGRFTGKQRNDLKRKKRLLAEAASGALRVQRIATEETVARVYGDLERVFEEARPRPGKRLPSVSKLQDAARRQFLRTYLMYAGENAIAYAVGYQAHGVFHYSDVGFSTKYTRWSPGTVLLYLITRDLADHRPVLWVNFGIGSAEYKRRFSNVTTQDAIVYVMRKTLRNRLRALGLGLLERAWRLKHRRRMAIAASQAPSSSVAAADGD